MRKNHCSHGRAIRDLLAAVCSCHSDDKEAVMTALKNGTISGTKCTEEEIEAMRNNTKTVRKRHGKCLRKVVHKPNTIRLELDAWFDKCKCSASDGSNNFQGKRDSRTNQTLFRSEAKAAKENAKINAECLQDPLTLDEMCTVISANPNSKHGLNECLARRDESSLESFHLLLAHFGNAGMRNSLTDNLNLTGAARCNLRIHHKLRLGQLGAQERKKLPAKWETIVSHTNHSELAHVNSLAKEAGVDNAPFPHAEPLGEDTGERFSECLDWLQSEKPGVDEKDMCKRCKCTGALPPAAAAPELQMTVDAAVDAAPTAAPTAAQFAAQQMAARKMMANCRLLPIWMVNPCAHLPQDMTPCDCVNAVGNFCCSAFREHFFRTDKRGKQPHSFGCRFRVQAAIKRRHKNNDSNAI